MSNNLNVFIHVPAAFLRGNLKGYTRESALREVEKVREFLSEQRVKMGLNSLYYPYFDPLTDTWDKSWEKKVADSDLHVYYMPQDMHSIGIGYYRNYIKHYKSTPQAIIYRRKHDNKLCSYEIDRVVLNVSYESNYHEYAIFQWGKNISIEHILNRFDPDDFEVDENGEIDITPKEDKSNIIQVYKTLI